MRELKSKATDTVSKYEERLHEKGIKIAVSKRYCEASVGGRDTYHTNAGISLLTHVEKWFDKKREKSKGYNYQSNRYHSLVLTIHPIDQGIARREDCKDYAFVLRKVERAYIGEKPQRIVIEEEKVLKQIEKRICKTLRKAETATPIKLCKDTPLDALRYCILPKYRYQKRILGKDRAWWEIFFCVVGILLMLAVMLVAWGISHLF